MNNSQIAIPSILKVGNGTLKDIGNDIRSGGMDKAQIIAGIGGGKVIAAEGVWIRG